MWFLQKWLRRFINGLSLTSVAGALLWGYSEWSAKYAIRYHKADADSVLGFGTAVRVINLGKQAKHISVRFDPRSTRLRDVVFLPLPDGVTQDSLRGAVRLADPTQGSEPKLFPHDRLGTNQAIHLVRSLEPGSGCSFTFVTDVPAGDAVVDVFAGLRSSAAVVTGDDLERWFVWLTFQQHPRLILLALLVVPAGWGLYLWYTWPSRGGLVGVFQRACRYPERDPFWDAFRNKLVPSFQARVVEKCLRLKVDPTPAVIESFWEALKTRASRIRPVPDTEARIDQLVDLWIDLALLHVPRR